MPLERPTSLNLDLPHLLSGFRGVYIVNAVVAFIFAASAPVAIILTAGRVGGLAEADIASWLFGCFFINGLISLAFCLAYRQPLVFFWTIPGTVLVGQALEHLTFAQVIGAYYATGALMVILGLSGWMRKCMKLLPMPIVMAMVAGVFLQFGLNLIFAIRDGFIIAAPMSAVFLLLSAVRPLGRSLPPLIGALVTGIVAIALSGTFELGGTAVHTFASPNLYVPEFSWAAMVEMVLPLAITVLAAQNAQGFAVLEAAGHKPPVNMITVACGIGSLIAASVGTVSTCLTGPVNAIITSSGEQGQALRLRCPGCVAGLAVRDFFTALCPLHVGNAEGLHRHACGACPGAHPGARLHRLLQGRVHPRRHGHFSRHRGQCPDPFDRRALLGLAHRICRILGA